MTHASPPDFAVTPHAELGRDIVFLLYGEGRKIVRYNLMGEMTGLLGTEDAVQRWFGSIKPASVPGSPLLHAMAKTRLEQAKSAFTNKFDVPFLSSSVAWQMRGRQNTRQGKGMLSHATGLAID